jgi:ligand-binding sensor protein
VRRNREARRGCFIFPLHVRLCLGVSPRNKTDVNNNSQNRLIQMLADSHIYKDYERAFGETTGLPLNLSSVEHWQLAHHDQKHENPFCALVAQFNKARTQQQTCDDPKTSEPHTVKGFGGLCETSVPLRLGENLIGFLRTGGVLFNGPTERGAPAR